MSTTILLRFFNRNTCTPTLLKPILLSLSILVLSSTSGQITLSKSYYQQKKKLAFEKILDYKKQTKNISNKTIVITNGPKSVISIGRDPLYPEPIKTIGNAATIPNQNCNIMPVNYKASYGEIAFFGADDSKIYPGAAFKASQLVNNHLEPYTSRERNPMKITTNIISEHNEVTKQLEHFDYASFNSLWVPFLYPKLKNGVTGADYAFSMYVAESMQQVKQDQKLVNENNVGLTLNLPIPDLPVSMGLGGEVTISNETISQYTSSSKKNYCVIKFEQIFYNATANIQDNGPLFKGSSPVDSDILYISKVEYGRIFIMTIESNANASQLINAINYKLTNKNKLEVDVVGIPAGGTLDNENSTSEQKNYTKLLASSELKITTYQKGGQVIYSGSDIDEAINKLTATTQFGPNNVGSPINYELSFADKHSNAWININNSYATANCGKQYEMLFDVELKLDHIEVVKCADPDKTEDLYGKIEFTWAKTGDHESGHDYTLWSRSKEDAKQYGWSVGSYRVDEKKHLFANLTFNELKKLEIYVGGKLYDDESPWGGPRVFRCNDCSEFDKDYGKRKIYFEDQEKTKISIDTLKMDGDIHALNFGSDKFFEMNFYESGRKEDGWVKFMFRVYVKPH